MPLYLVRHGESVPDEHTKTGKNCSSMWQVYMVLCSDGSLYTGITKDISRRLQEHATGKGAKYFRGRQPKEVVYLEDLYNRSDATRREMEIKRMSVSEKSRLLASPNNLRGFPFDG